MKRSSTSYSDILQCLYIRGEELGFLHDIRVFEEIDDNLSYDRDRDRIPKLTISTFVFWVQVKRIREALHPSTFSRCNAADTFIVNNTEFVSITGN